MSDLSKIFAAMDATWPAEERIACGPLTLRRSSGGGKRVSAASADGPVTSQDINAAEAQMRAFGQTPLFSLRDGDAALDDMLAARGYMVVELTRARATTEYRFTGNVRQRSTKLAGTKRISAAAGAGKLDV